MTEQTSNLPQGQAAKAVVGPSAPRSATAATERVAARHHDWRKIGWDLLIAAGLALVFAVAADWTMHHAPAEALPQDFCEALVSEAELRAVELPRLTGPAVLNCIDLPRKRVEVPA